MKVNFEPKIQRINVKCFGNVTVKLNDTKIPPNNEKFMPMNNDNFFDSKRNERMKR
jgi:hypothetical protein